MYAKVLDKIFMAQRSKGRMSIDWWYSWVLRSKADQDKLLLLRISNKDRLLK